VATVSRLLKIIGLFCRIKSLLYGSFAKETYDFKEPTNRSHPICMCERESACAYDSVNAGMQNNQYIYFQMCVCDCVYVCVSM